MLQNELHVFVARFTEVLESNGLYYDITSLCCKPLFHPRSLKDSVGVKYWRKLVGNFFSTRNTGFQLFL